jgi:hypothetical protein
LDGRGEIAFHAVRRALIVRFVRFDFVATGLMMRPYTGPDTRTHL